MFTIEHSPAAGDPGWVLQSEAFEGDHHFIDIEANGAVVVMPCRVGAHLSLQDARAYLSELVRVVEAAENYARTGVV